MPRVLLDSVIHTDYGQFDLLWGDDYGFDGNLDGNFDQYFARQVNGLVGASSPNGVYLHFARRSGGSGVRIHLLETAPPVDDAQWEDIVEVSIDVPAGVEVSWQSWAGESRGSIDLPGGTYRVRANARGRDAGRDGEFAEGIVDEYLLELWPSDPEPDAIIRSTSADASYWHNEVGGRR